MQVTNSPLQLLAAGHAYFHLSMHPPFNIILPKKDLILERVFLWYIYIFTYIHCKRPLTPKSMPPAGDEHAKLTT